MGLGAMKNLESSAKERGLEDTVPFEQGRDGVTREVWRTSYSRDVEGFTGKGAVRASQVSGAAAREAGARIGSFCSCAEWVGAMPGALSWRSVYADTIENKVTGTRRPAESVSLLFLNFTQAIHLPGKLPSKESY